MKQILLLTAMIGVGLSASAQNKVLIYGGPQLSSASYIVNGKTQQVNTKVGFHLGTAMKVPVEGHFYFAPTVFYSLKGYKVNFNEPSTPPDPEAISNETRIHTAEIAPLFQFDFGKKASHLFFRFGPTIDIQLKGRETFTMPDKSTVTRPMKYSFKDYGYVGANIVATLGYETAGGAWFGVTASHGLGSINNTDYGARIVPQVLGVSFGKYIKR